MPIYAYKCASCGHAKDALQKISDAPLTVCPQCGASAFSKQLTAAGFQLKGSGWYATDFRDGGGKKASEKGESDKGDSDKGASAPAEGASAPAGPAAAPAAPSPAPGPSP